MELFWGNIVCVWSVMYRMHCNTKIVLNYNYVNEGGQAITIHLSGSHRLDSSATCWSWGWTAYFHQFVSMCIEGVFASVRRFVLANVYVWMHKNRVKTPLSCDPASCPGVYLNSHLCTPSFRWERKKNQSCPPFLHSKIKVLCVNLCEVVVP